MSDFKTYWRTWLWRDAVTKIITVNTIVWLLLGAADLLAPRIGHAALGALVLPPTWAMLLTHPWTLATYMFTHTDFLHLLVNMMWLLLFGRLLCDMQGGYRTTIVYAYGGVAAALVFVAVNNAGHAPLTVMYGASCAVLAVVGATATLFPRIRVNLLIFGEVQMVWLAVAAVILIATSWTSMPSVAAHLTGLAVGVAYGLGRNRGVDITAPVMRVIAAVNGRKVPTARPYRQASDEQELDSLLAKVSRSGYASLTPQERQRLFILSQKIKK